MQQNIIGFIRGLSKSIIRGFTEAQNNCGIGISIEEGIEKSRRIIFNTGVAISIVAIGFFLISWGIASAIEAMFVMRGLGFVLIGLLGVLTGALLFKN